MAQEKPTIPVYLNHVIITLDEETYEAIGANPFVRGEYAPFSQSTKTSEAAGTYSGSYLYGENTYIELFASESDEGYCAIGFGVEQIGASVDVCSQLNAAFGGDVSPQLNFQIEEEQRVPWFYFIDLPLPALANSNLNTWIMEYLPDIFQHRELKVPSSGDLTRKAYLIQKRNLFPSALIKPKISNA